MCFQLVSSPLWNVRILVSFSSLVDQFWNIVIHFRALSPIFVSCNSDLSVIVAGHETAKSISSVGIQFRQIFIQSRPPDIRSTDRQRSCHYNTYRVGVCIIYTNKLLLMIKRSTYLIISIFQWKASKIKSYHEKVKM